MLPIISKWHKHALATLGALTIVAGGTPRWGGEPTTAKKKEKRKKKNV